MNARFATPADDALLASIFAHPEVACWTSCDGAAAFDPKAYTAHPKSFAVIVDGGCWLCAALEQDAYGVHAAMLPECRGAAAVAAAEFALHLVFTRTDAEQLWACIPSSNKAAIAFAVHRGFRRQLVHASMWIKDGEAVAMELMRLDIDDWIQGAGLPDQTAAHRYERSTTDMLLAGQADKAQHVFNRWARACGVTPMEVRV